MSYSITISGHAADADHERALTTALAAALDNPNAEYGVTAAQAFTQFNGTVNLLPAAPPVPDPKEDLDAAVTALDDKLAEVFAPAATGGPVDVAADDVAAILSAMADVQSEVEAYEASVSDALASAEGNSASSSAGSSTPPAAATSSPDGASTSDTGFGTAQNPTLSDGTAVAL